jgi:hypothetical protein
LPKHSACRSWLSKPNSVLNTRYTLAAGHVPVWVAASFDGDIVLVPADQVDEAAELLRQAGHQVIG